ncbi:MAG: site-specific DNA-methyltransferase [Chloroflexi bacterium]|nr:site-specific DNA-methyltransferase [Chloroflexota bacterium]
MPAANQIVLADNLAVLRRLPPGSVDLIYIDPPFNTGHPREHRSLSVVHDEAGGDRTGFGGRRYRSLPSPATAAYDDAYDDYLAFLEPRLVEAHRVLTPTGALYVHLDYREVHYVKVLLDGIFGRANFLNEIVWAYDFGGRSRRRWPAKHDTILYYARDARDYVFNVDAIDRIPYLAPGLVGPAKAARGKLPASVWWQTIVSPTGKEKTGYPTQKPLAIARRIITASSRPGDLVLDFFAGSGTTGVAAHALGRHFLLVDSNPAAVEIMARRLPPEIATVVTWPAE